MKPKKASSKAASEAVAVNRRRLLNNASPFAIKEAYVKLRTSLMFCMTADKKLQALGGQEPDGGQRCDQLRDAWKESPADRCGYA